jgi:hypothetical protein
MTGATGPAADEQHEFHARMLAALRASGVPFLVGGAAQLRHFTDVVRPTKDLDVFVRPSDAQRALAVLAAAGCETWVPFPHWLGKARGPEGFFVDVIFSSGNGIAQVDDAWFEAAIPATVYGIPVRLCPVEETIWSKAFVMERERYDGADVAHLLLACGRRLDWDRMLRRFGPHWRVLLSHVVLFGFIYPNEPPPAPAWVLGRLIGRLRTDTASPPADGRVCQGTLLSRTQYREDVEQGFHDARLRPSGRLTAEEVCRWTEGDDDPVGCAGRR